MKMFSSKQTRDILARAGARLSGTTHASVQMKQIAWLDNSISQINTLKAFKPDAKGLAAGIDTLMGCKSEIYKAIQPPVTQLPPVEQSKPSVSEGPSFSRRP